MAFSAHKDPDQVKEHFDPDEVIKQKVKTLADLIRKSRHLIAFTGAGVSTSAGIPDFRGPQGAWTLMAQGKEHVSADTMQAIPTRTHMALVELQNRGVLKYLVSQNTDGLHRRSGILKDHISELHGNSNRECCKRCGKEYIRDFKAVAPYTETIFDHKTGRRCLTCRGDLHDTIIHFTESLPAEPLEKARDHAKKADVCLALGSSLTVTPANSIAETVGRRKASRLVICNLQDTPLDNLADVRVYAKTDDLMGRVMHELGFPIPDFVLRRWLKVELVPGKRQCEVRVEGVDIDGSPVTYIRSARVGGSTARCEPFVFRVSGALDDMEVEVELEFMGHYGEPNLELVHSYKGDADLECTYVLEYNPGTGEWKNQEA